MLAAVIALTLITIVPLKSLVGVIVKPAVEVAVGPHAPVAEIEEIESPPKAIVTDPAVRPVIV